MKHFITVGFLLVSWVGLSQSMKPSDKCTQSYQITPEGCTLHCQYKNYNFVDRKDFTINENHIENLVTVLIKYGGIEVGMKDEVKEHVKACSGQASVSNSMAITEKCKVISRYSDCVVNAQGIDKNNYDSAIAAYDNTIDV